MYEIGFKKAVESNMHKCAFSLPIEYRSRFIVDHALLNKENTAFHLVHHQCCLKNYNFYLNKIESIHQKKGDYYWLESQHDYIQWMFPNHYQSRVNYQSEAMGYREV